MTVHRNLLAGNQGKVYQVLRRAALGSQPCPTNREIADAIGCGVISTVSSAIHRLRDAGLFRIERFAGEREIVFPDGVQTTRVDQWRAVREQVAAAFDVEPHLIVSRNRRKYIVRARMACAWVLRHRFEGMSFEAIGRLLARDHSTIMHAVEQAEYYRERDPAFRAATDALRHGEPVERALAVMAPAPRHCAKHRPTKVEAEAPAAEWCSQCEARVMPERAARCAARWCALRMAIAA